MIHESEPVKTGYFSNMRHRLIATIIVYNEMVIVHGRIVICIDRGKVYSRIIAYSMHLAELFYALRFCTLIIAVAEINFWLQIERHNVRYRKTSSKH